MNRLAGRYALEREVARGGGGTVWFARDPEGRAVAVKFLLGASAHQRRRMATEIQTLLRLRHPGVVSLLDAGEEVGSPFLVTEWVEGESLGARLARQGPLPPLEAVELVERLAVALEHCHAHGVLHRDLKPDNVLLRASDGAPLLADFGLSKDLQAASQSAGPDTVAGGWLGTPGYWPPEQAGGRVEAIGPASDVYGLAAILYALLTGHPPQEGLTLQEMMQAVQRPPTPPSRRRRGVPSWLDAPCLRGLANDPARRPAGPLAFARELAAARRAAATPRSAVRAVLVAVMLLLLGGTAAGALVWRRSRSVTPAADVASGDAPAHVKRGRELLRRFHSREALAEFERALELEPRLAEAHAGRGSALGQLDRLDEALASVERALELAPDLAAAHGSRGAVLARLGRREESLACLERSIALDPNDPMARTNRGVLLSIAGRHREALPDFDRALELDPRDARAWYLRGTARSMLNELEGAAADFGQALVLGPDPSTSRRRLHAARGTALRKLGRHREALPDLDAALRPDGPDPVDRAYYLERAIAYVALGRPREALADCDELVAAVPGEVQGWKLRGVLRSSMGRHAEAAEDLQRALALDPRAADAWNARGSALVSLGQLTEAIVHFSRAVELDPDMSQAWSNRGSARAELGQLEDALVDLERALKLDPGHRKALAQRARVRAKLGLD